MAEPPSTRDPSRSDIAIVPGGRQRSAITNPCRAGPAPRGWRLEGQPAVCYPRRLRGASGSQQSAAAKRDPDPRQRFNVQQGGRNQMKGWLTTALLVMGLAGLWHEASGQGDAGWITLFDGKSLDNWAQIGNANWTLADGVVQADKGNGFLVSKSSYTDFQIRAEFWVDADANSGIFIRCTDPNKVGSANAYEVNIFAKRPKFTVTLNGTKTVDGAEDSKFASGRIALQYGAGVVKFRKVQVKPL